MNKQTIWLLILVLCAVSTPLWGQKTLRFEGAFNAGDRVPAEANYSYYLNEKNQKVKHGSFRYAIKQTRNSGSFKQRYIVNFQGDYQHGLKTGEWSYRVMSRNFDFDKEGYYYTKEITLEANYVDGLADGVWEYKAKVTKRQLLDKARNKWSVDQDVKDVYVKLNFNKGLLHDSLVFTNELGYSIKALMDKNGMLNGEVLVLEKNKQRSKTAYKGGVEKRYNKTADRFVDSPEWDALQSFAKTGQPGLQVDTLSFLHNGSMLSRQLMAEVFNDKVFRYAYIDGDKMVVRKQNKWAFAPEVQGMRYVKMKPQLSKEEAATIRRFYSIQQKLEIEKRKLNKQRSEKPNDAKLRHKEMELHQDINRIKSLICMSKELKQRVSTKEAVAKANNGCGEFPEAYDLMTRSELLQRMLGEAKQIENKYKQRN